MKDRFPFKEYQLIDRKLRFLGKLGSDVLPQLKTLMISANRSYIVAHVVLGPGHFAELWAWADEEGRAWEWAE